MRLQQRFSLILAGSAQHFVCRQAVQAGKIPAQDHTAVGVGKLRLVTLLEQHATLGPYRIG
ncbi:hypothetical protein D3C76_1623050 [compost metagenome]